MNLVFYKQTFTHSCLVACFLMLLKATQGIEFDGKIEERILTKGTKRIHPLYVVGISKEIAKKFNLKISVIADNKYFTKVLIHSFADSENFSVFHQKVTIPQITQLLSRNLLICHIDNYYLNGATHESHFILLEKLTNKGIKTYDPLVGKRRFLTFGKLEKSILSLKTLIKMCPLLIYLPA